MIHPAGEWMPDRGAATGEGQVAGRPYVLLSAAMSVDGYIDDASPLRLVLSGEEDLDRVDAVRSLALSGVLLAPRFSAIGNDEV
jgi:hypothetical protein